MKKFCFALDLKDDPKLINEYKEHHRNFWPELREDARQKGIKSLEIYNVANRLFMIWETNDDYEPGQSTIKEDSFLAKRSREWEQLMAQYQQPVFPGNDNRKWVPMERIFEL